MDSDKATWDARRFLLTAAVFLSTQKTSRPILTYGRGTHLRAVKNQPGELVVGSNFCPERIAREQEDWAAHDHMHLPAYHSTVEKGSWRVH